eukprot:TRINITY_DN3878_c1_g2_i2.p1 TRINITY_DN3878_c1_g2~~TRINITY_DN3878_c1_g2_i2.p1  ORF type:complete len:390 (-),score=52.89 TRINITY_DN3878_c1_g2_i2:9-1178(-)
MEQKSLDALADVIISKKFTLSVLKLENIVKIASFNFKKHFTEVITNIQTCTNFKYLSLANNHLGKSNILALSTVFGNSNVTIHGINLKGVKISKNYFWSAMEAMFEGNNWCLTTLDISEIPMEPRTLLEINKFIRSSVSLKTLNLSSTQIEASGVCNVITSIEANDDLAVTLLLKDNNFTSKSSKIISETLSRGVSRILSLDLTDNPLGDKGSAIIFQALAKTKIQQLICNYTFKLKGKEERQQLIQSIAQLLKADILTRLEIKGDAQKSSTQLRQSFIPIFRAVGEAPSLRVLNIEQHQIGHDGLIWLAKAIQVNNELREIYWEGNDLSFLALERFNKVISETKHVLVFPIPILEVVCLRSELPEFSNRIQTIVNNIETNIRIYNCQK